MSAQVLNYKCPSCGAPLHFNEGTGRLSCEYCRSEYTPEEIAALYADDARYTASSQHATTDTNRDEFNSLNKGTEPDADTVWNAAADGMKTYSCPSCGASLICDATTAATSCPYCGNPAIIQTQLDAGHRPDYIIPFRLSRDDAVSALKKHYRKNPFLPLTFIRTTHIDKITGVYVPVWMFDYKVSGEVTFHATSDFVYIDGEYEIIDTDHYDVYRAGSISLKKVPVNASSKLPRDYMDSIEPYDYTDLRPFSMTYLPGFMADRYDVDIDTARWRARERCKQTLAEQLKKTVKGYDSCKEKQRTMCLEQGKVHYALLPVWLLNTSWNGTGYLFAMNGQTGALAGDLPVSKAQLILVFFLIAAMFTPIVIKLAFL